VAENEQELDLSIFGGSQGSPSSQAPIVGSTEPARPISSTSLEGVVGRSVGRPSQYPWKAWCDDRFHLLARGADFKVSVETFQSIVHRYARRNGRLARTQRVPQTDLVRIGLFSSMAAFVEAETAAQDDGPQE
jgi:hypothetical protein